MRFYDRFGKNPNAVRGGKVAQSRGKQFEQWIQNRCDATGWALVRIPNGGERGHGSFFPTTSPFDFVAVKAGWSIFFDAKTIDAKSFRQSLIKPRQLAILLKLEKQRVPAGYLIYFQPLNQLRFFSATQLANVKPGQGLKPDQGTLLGTYQNFSMDRINVLFFDHKTNDDTDCETDCSACDV